MCTVIFSSHTGLIYKVGNDKYVLPSGPTKAVSLSLLMSAVLFPLLTSSATMVAVAEVMTLATACNAHLKKQPFNLRYENPHDEIHTGT